VITTRHGRIVVAILCCLLTFTTRAAAAESQVPAHLADSWATCQEQVYARFGSRAVVSFGPATPRLDTARGVGYLFGTVYGHRFVCEMRTDGKTFWVTRVIVED